MRTLIVLMLAAVALAGCANAGPRPAPLTRSEIVQLANSGAPAATIIERLEATGSVIFLSASEILDLDRQGVPPEVLDWLQREQVLELRRRDAFDHYWRHPWPFAGCAGWPGGLHPPPFMLRPPYWPFCY